MNQETIIVQTYRVSGNWDRIKQYPSLKQYHWEHDPVIHNKVSCEFIDIEQAEECFKLVHKFMCCAIKNWS